MGVGIAAAFVLIPDSFHHLPQKSLVCTTVDARLFYIPSTWDVCFRRRQHGVVSPTAITWVTDFAQAVAQLLPAFSIAICPIQLLSAFSIAICPIQLLSAFSIVICPVQLLSAFSIVVSSFQLLPAFSIVICPIQLLAAFSIVVTSFQLLSAFSSVRYSIDIFNGSRSERPVEHSGSPT